MTQDEIIEMAREAGFGMPWLSHEEHQAIFTFAKLVAAKERERIKEEQQRCYVVRGEAV